MARKKSKTHKKLAHKKSAPKTGRAAAVRTTGKPPGRAAQHRGIGRTGKAAELKGRIAGLAADKKVAAGALPQWTAAETEEAFRRFQSVNPAPKGELAHIDPFTLLVAVVLSAQATDAGVNKATPALFAAGLGGVLTLSDPGPGQILGFSTAASEILTSFASRYDLALAGRQCVMLTALVLVITAPLVAFAAPRLTNAVMARQSREIRRARHQRIAGVTMTALGFVVFIGTVAPLVGLTLPLVGEATFLRAWRELSRTAGNTLGYAVGAGTIATALGLLLALCAGRNVRTRTACLGIALGLLSLPPAFTALGVIQLATAAPAWADPLLRSRFTVCVVLGLRFFPIAAVLGLRAWGATSVSWVFAASVHGVSLGAYLQRVLLPLLLPVGGVSLLLVALLATADITTVLLLHPPGESSLPLVIFTVMANAPETLVASLCFVYVAATAGLLLTVWTITGRRGA
jgi:ABC-type Fe3+ transport system permease subunit